MGTKPHVIKIVRSGRVESIRVDSMQVALRLRTELELIRQCGLGADDAVCKAIASLADGTGDDDARDLHHVLQDAAHPIIEDSISRIDRQWPAIRAELPYEVINEESARFRGDIADRIRAAEQPGLAALAAAYEKRSSALAAEATAPGPPRSQETHQQGDAAEAATSEQEDTTMTDPNSDTNPVDFEALAQNVDNAIDASAKAAADDVEAALQAAVDAADQLELGDCNADVEAILNNAMTPVETTSGPAPTPGPPPATAQNATPTSAPQPTDPAPAAESPPLDEPMPSQEELDAAVAEADKLDVGDVNADIDEVIADTLANVEQLATDEPAAETDGVDGLTPAADRPAPTPEIMGVADAADEVESTLADVEAGVEKLAQEVDAPPAGQASTGAPPATTTPTPSEVHPHNTAVETAVAGVEATVNAVAEQVGAVKPPAAPADADDVVAAVAQADAVWPDASDADDLNDATAAEELVASLFQRGDAPPNANDADTPSQPPSMREMPAPFEPQPPEAQEALAPAPPETPTPEPQAAIEPEPTPAPAEMWSAPATQAFDTGVPNSDSPTATRPLAGADQIQNGIRALAQFLTGEVQQLWNAAHQAMAEAQTFRNVAERNHIEIQQMHADIRAMRQEIADAREQAQTHRQEACNLRDDIHKALERVRLCACDAANAADQAQSEARNAALHARQARDGNAPGPKP